MTVFSFLVFLGLFTLIGLSSAAKSRGNKADYYVASATIKPWLIGMSAFATQSSGYMFIGVIGFTYTTGLAAFWLMVGWLLGDFIASTRIHRRLREAAERTGEVSYAGVLSHWYGQNYTTLQRVIGIISLIFLTTYASAQLLAGGKALHVLLQWPDWSGAVAGAVMVAAYTMAGGIRASIWTDAAQATVMLFAMGLLLFIGTREAGGIGAVADSLQQIEGYTDWIPPSLAIPGLAGLLLFILGWMFGGASVIGQPQVMVRFIALDDAKNMNTTRVWYYVWFGVFYLLATGVGMLSRIYLSGADFDAELALPTMAMELLHPVFVGLVLAGVFAATMSTADSVVLSCSAAVTHDILPFTEERLWVLKATTITIILCALGFALFNSGSVFSLVIFSWAALASAFAPLLIAHCFGVKTSQRASILALFSGLAAALGWRLAGQHDWLYEGTIGILVGCLVLFIAGRQPQESAAPSVANVSG
ncbi:Na+/solute symporter [Luminiphilus syltensis NOR5-1B]|uniref:Sodium/proline symporter n=1 Tax=Luminiphilus syltensis NOR5-1B TaxID=565045 RepID=B8KX51_9GAMM|nr:sodium/proline symporter [Luminiphilus syltensis]EED35734.1 Na+/solute symporter [Luminiphilus syltensis NOR5-1B]